MATQDFGRQSFSYVLVFIFIMYLYEWPIRVKDNQHFIDFVCLNCHIRFALRILKLFDETFTLVPEV